MDAEQEKKKILFWKQESSWMKVFIKASFVLVLYLIFLFFIGLINPVWIGYGDFRVNIIRISFSAMLIAIIFCLHKNKADSFSNFFKELGVSLNKTILSKHFRYYFIAIFALFALYTSLELTNAEYAHMLNFLPSQGVYRSFFNISIALVTMILEVAFWEELIFRGYLQQILYFGFLEYFLTKNKNKTFKFNSRVAVFIAILVSSLVFIFFHFASFKQYIFGLRFYNIFFGSIIFGYIFYKSRDIFSTTLIHASYNILSSVVNFVIIKKIEYLNALLENGLRARGFGEDIIGNVTDILHKVGKGV